MQANTEPVKPVVGTICSALVENEQGQVLVSETEHGISMLGGFVNWSSRFPRCLEERVIIENGIRIKPRRIQGIFQNHTRSGSWITNINVLASCDDSINSKDCYWLDKHAILEGQRYQARTPDLLWAIGNSLQNMQGVGLDFVTVTQRDQQTSGLEITSMPVTGMVIKNPYTERFLLMQCGRDERKADVGKWSLLGGTANLGEGRRRTISREVQEEGGITPVEIGLVGLYVNHVPAINSYVANIASAGYHYQERVQTSAKFKREVQYLEWFTLEEINAMNPESFRTLDVTPAINHAEWLSQHGGFFDKNLVRQVRYALPGIE